MLSYVTKQQNEEKRKETYKYHGHETTWTHALQIS